MIVVRRARGSEDIETPDGRRATLETETWTIGAAFRNAGGGWSYRRPRSVRLDGHPAVRLVDHQMLVRLSLIALMLIVAVMRRSTP